MLDHRLKPEPEPVRRLEVITGTVRRPRFFSDDDKARIIEETHLLQELLFRWLRVAMGYPRSTVLLAPTSEAAWGDKRGRGSATVRPGGRRSAIARAHSSSSKARSTAPIGNSP
jgi:hypothetical protein